MLASRNEQQRREYFDNSNKKIEAANEETYLQLPNNLLEKTLKAEGKSQSEIESILETIGKRREKIAKVVKKFTRKLEAKYGHLDTSELLNKGIKHAEKSGLNELEKKVFIHSITSGKMDTFTLSGEIKYSPMAKFLGMDQTGPIIEISPKDQDKLKKLIKLYEDTKSLHFEVKGQSYQYKDCGYEAISGGYVAEKHLASAHIHPIIAALFIPKIELFEKLIIKANIGRMILQRTALMAGESVVNSVDLGEFEADFDLSQNIANDPNSLSYFTNDAPLENIIKRFEVQIELWKNILNLRQGRYYSSGFSYSHDFKDDGITGFIKTISRYDWTFFDNPTLYQQQDEGVILKKLLAIFSIRPTFTSVSSYINRGGFGQTSLVGLARNSYINLPVINIRLPQFSSEANAITIENTINQSDYFVENRMLVPKSKSVIYSRDVIFFYADRRDKVPAFVNNNSIYRYVSMPASVGSVMIINDTELYFDDTMRIGRDLFMLRSVVLIETPHNIPNIITGHSASIVVKPNTFTTLSEKTYINYNPVDSSVKYQVSPNLYQWNQPFTYLPERSIDNSPAFKDSAIKRGTIFLYTKVDNNLGYQMM